MSTTIFLLLLIASSSMIVYGRSLTNPEQFMPLLLSSSVNDDSTTSAHASDGRSRMLEIVAHITKYVSTIKSNEEFIDNIINHHSQVVDKLKILHFLKNCFQITHAIIQQEINYITDMLIVNKKSSAAPLQTITELQEAQDKIETLINVIDERTMLLKTWVPPTIPFLSF
ncbi:unnamed protein product [Adineta steineri]|uniref:Uncharacterized protein n=1 Tax=Adineta steineri TaxID=433720 RepID=A0A815IJI2_9BILA|nr:unnamed protein product [Adineta steineri]